MCKHWGEENGDKLMDRKESVCLDYGQGAWACTDIPATTRSAVIGLKLQERWKKTCIKFR